MDSVTQALLGATIAEAGFRPTLGRRAVAFGALCGLLPDFDMVSRFWGPWASMLYHRGPTHSLIVLAAVSPLLGWLAWRVGGRTGRWGQWAHLAFWALLTHPLLDWCTAYGTQLLSPVSGGRFAIDAVGILDPVYSVPLLVATGLALCRRGAQRVARPVAIAALVFTTLYLALGVGVSQYLASRGRAVLGRQVETARIERIRAMPVALCSNQLWRVVADLGEGRVAAAYTRIWAPDDMVFSFYESDRGPLVDAALASREGRIFTWFADNYLTVHQEVVDGKQTVFLADRRYGRFTEPSRSLFGARAVFGPEGRLLSVRRERGRGGFDIKRELSAAWAFIRYGLRSR